MLKLIAVQKLETRIAELEQRVADLEPSLEELDYANEQIRKLFRQQREIIADGVTFSLEDDEHDSRTRRASDVNQTLQATPERD